MPRGRIPAPTATNQLRGDPSRRRRNTKEPKPPKGWPTKPKEFDDDPIASEEWDSICAHLDEMNLLSKADRTGLEIYCRTYSRYRDAEAKVSKFGDVFVTKSGHAQVSPWFTTRNRYADECRRWLLEWGLTPAARARMRIQVEDKQNDRTTEKYLRVVG